MTISVATWNVNGIRAREAQVREWLDAHRPEVFCLQEIKAKPEQIPQGLLALEGYHVAWHGAGGYSGVALGVRRDVSEQPPAWLHPDFDFETRALTATVAGIEFASLYVPNGGKDFDAKMRFLGAVRDWLGGPPAMRIVCGDLNVARSERDIHPKERKPGQVGARPEERSLLGEILATGMVDVGRELDPDNDGLFTWWAPWRSLRQKNIGWRIDYVLASEALGRKATSSRVHADYGTSDHAPLVATFDL
ncbi:MAG: exodeoxyribonuclease III [Acidobacteriota bacterium]